MDKYKNIVLKLKEKGIAFDCAMSPKEMVEAEKFYDISFPVELQKLYSLGLPVSKGFYNWRDMSSKNISLIKNALETPIKGLQLDLENGDFWCESWGLQPDNIEEAQSILLKHYNNAPKLMPIYSHRYIPFIPDSEEVPVFSIMGSDIVYYGENLIAYLETEFKIREYDNNMNCQYINFWSDLL